ncbi:MULTISPECIES: sensor histidine kinase [unclassified Leeuwenhoekiella]|uniref:sensor histidine kinase n=2 Tax=Leeuwenhoekiella TaxID=283735 RepID=UPI0025C62149|nr:MULTISPECIES: sensor histidine kinase [unclassified Leeuwenhoekiella]
MQQRIVYNVDFWSRIRYPDNFSPLAKDSTFMNPYLDIMKGISDYYQFRYIDSTGQELLRIERDGKTQKLVEGKLQNKAGRKYFERGTKLKHGEIYLSEINLNRENGQLEESRLPVIRAIAPIYSESGDKLGIVVINFNLTNLLNRLKVQLTESNFYLVDQNLRIVSTNTDLPDLGYELQDSSFLKKKYVLEELSPASLKNDSTFMHSGSLWCVRTLNLNQDYGENKSNYISDKVVRTASSWTVIHQVPRPLLRTILWPLYRNIILVNVLAFGLLIICSTIFVKKESDKKFFYKELDAKNQRLEYKRETLKVANESLNALNLRLEKRNQQLEEFNYLVSHNLRAPITSMSLIVELISEAKSLDELKNLTPKLCKVTDNITDITEDIKEYVTILNNKQVKLEEINILSVIESCKSDFADLLLDKIDFKIDCDLQAWDKLYFSRFYFKSVVQNLMSNAIKYRREEVASYLLFRTTYEDGVKVLYVKDNGRGINLDLHGANLFKLYKRFHRDVSGKGMGLFIVKSQLESLDAEITIISKEHEGSEFKIKFNKI